MRVSFYHFQKLSIEIKSWPISKEDKIFSLAFIKMFKIINFLDKNLIKNQQKMEYLYLFFLDLKGNSFAPAHWVCFLLNWEILKYDKLFSFPFPVPCIYKLRAKEGEFFRQQVEQSKDLGLKHIQFAIALYLFDRNILNMLIPINNYVETQKQRILALKELSDQIEI